MLEINLGPVTIAVDDGGLTYVRDNSLDAMPRPNAPLTNRDWANFFTLCALLSEEWYQQLVCEDKAPLLLQLQRICDPQIIDRPTTDVMNEYCSEVAHHYLVDHDMPMPTVDLSLEHPTMSYSTKRVLMFLIRR